MYSDNEPPDSNNNRSHVLFRILKKKSDVENHPNKSKKARDLHATLIQRCHNVDKVHRGRAESLAIVNENDPIVAGLVMVSVTVLYEKIEYGRIDQVQQSR